ncbi:unnamed protein product [Rotaria sp. Silwood2]|nr:unnamed protein product [Rotaria sp. Silwood2]CAF2919527.1 unnamed protein product [Rotaria sp. Silwood2]CAF4224552.1 unnamed protein product [Rotaria sp. Silwood2]CAF4456976.1 unnamed protein product [Rotaria sp. Silwood2]
MGVTGTLETLSDPEKEVIKIVYKIGKNTYTSSVFGKNNLKFREKDDISIENIDNYFNTIRREIDDRLVGGKSSEKRAVLVIFESISKLKEFYESKALEAIKPSVAYLTEEASSKEKEVTIKRATTSGQITLLTRTFGRGTDFVCYGPSVVNNDGTHVIQTFLSEEKQIKGRTARQGNYGSYSMILLDSDLEKFLIQKEDIENVKRGVRILVRRASALTTTKKTYDTVYELLHEKHTDLFKAQYEANTKFIKQAKERHDATQQFLKSLNSGDVNFVRTFLAKENEGPNMGSGQSRTICLMDATGSMSHLLHRCKNTVEIMFERTIAVLRDNNISEGSFQIQFVVYRNYCCVEDKILQSSPLETKADHLRAFMSSINVEGGLGNEAIEIGLQHSNSENEREAITQVILIGDEPPNTRDEVKSKRNNRGEAYWQTTKFAQETYYENELEKLISKNIPVYAFFVANRAEAIFRQIANKTKGRCELLDINSSSGADMLTDLVTEVILKNVGGDSKGNALVAAYQKKFPKSYA